MRVKENINDIKLEIIPKQLRNKEKLKNKNKGHPGGSVG